MKFTKESESSKKNNDLVQGIKDSDTTRNNSGDSCSSHKSIFVEAKKYLDSIREREEDRR